MGKRKAFSEEVTSLVHAFNDLVVAAGGIPGPYNVKNYGAAESLLVHLKHEEILSIARAGLQDSWHRAKLMDWGLSHLRQNLNSLREKNSGAATDNIGASPMAKWKRAVLND